MTKTTCFAQFAPFPWGFRTTLWRRSLGLQPCQRPGVGKSRMCSLECDKRRILDTLRRDLVRQYDAPWTIDFSIYSDRVRFTDPVTRLPPNLLLYKGMIFVIAAIIAVLFRPTSARFIVESCDLESGDEECPNGRIITRFRTIASTRWSSPSSPPLLISGTDRFWLEKDSRSGEPRISYHESSWDQTPEQVKNDFLHVGSLDT
jgi:hypothetical protein